MNDDYISRAAILQEAHAISGPITGDGWDNFGVYALIERQPAADVAPVVHARWVYNKGDNIPYCSACMMPQDSECNYCPSCGARMDGDEQDGNN